MKQSTNQNQDWTARVRDWADIQEAVSVPLYDLVLGKLGIGEGAALLDIGCGSGIFCAMAAERGTRVSGIDASEPLLAIARERVPDGDFRVADMVELPFEDKSFDFVAGFNSFQFSADPLGALREAKRVSRTGPVSIIIFAEPEENEFTAFLQAVGSLLPTTAAPMPAK